MDRAVKGLEAILSGHGDGCHGVKHALTVVDHVDAAIKAHSGTLTLKEKLAIRLAALLHDADDRKFFPTSKDLSNAKGILKSLPEVDQETFDLVIKMINLVSCSKNGNSWAGADHEWQLYPRFADRLEATGEIGIVRCWIYTSHVNRPPFVEETPRPKTREELYKVAGPERLEHYVKEKGKVGSSSFIDHFYDKVLHISDLGTNPYFVEEAKKRHQVVEDFLLKFGQTGELDHEYLEGLAKKYL